MRRFLIASILLAVFCSAQAQTAGKYGEAELVATNASDVVTEIAFFTPEIVNVRHYKTGCGIKKQNLVVTLAKQDCAVTIDESDETVTTITSKALTVKYHKSTGRVSFFNKDGKQLLAEKAGATSLTTRKDGPFDSFKVKQTFTLSANEKLFGLGQLQNGNWDHRGKTYSYMIQGNMIVWIPYIHSNNGYALYWDNASPTTYSDDAYGMSFESAVGYGVDYFFLLGSTIDGQVAIQRMRQLTGQLPMIPLWAWGFFQSKERYMSADETMGVVDHYRRVNVPLDCVVQDWQYWGGNNLWNGMEFKNSSFSNYQTMIDSVHRMNAHMLISIWANFGPDTKPYAYFKQHNMLMKQGDKIMTDTYPGGAGVAIYDPYNSEARDKYWEFFYNGIASKGVDAYWMDSSEPDHYQGGSAMEETFDFVTGMGCTWRSVRDAFPLVHVGGVYDHHRAEPNLAEKRCMILTRSGYAGLQRYGANTWSGDVTASWETLAKQIPAALNYSVCGNPLWNSDTGAFFNGDLGGPGNDEYNELYARWLQFSAFCPMMRSHGAGTDKAIWVWGRRGMQFFDNEERYIALRYRLLPYIYSTAWDMHTNGHSMMNPLALLFPADKYALTVKTEYLFGQSILVAPVLKYQAKSCTVYLPKIANAESQNDKWFDFWTGKTYKGGQNTSKKVDLQTLPLYVRAGTILPMAQKRMYAKVDDWDTLQLRIYPGMDASFTLYEDEGDSYRYEQGQYSTIALTWDDANRSLTIGQRNGSFNGMNEKRVFDVVLVSEGVGTADTLCTTVHARINYDGSEQTIVIDPSNSIEAEYAVINNQPEESEEKTIPFEYHAREWETGDPSRVSQSNISYNTAANTITLRTKGSQNAALSLKKNLSDKYYVSREHPFFCIKAKGTTGVANDAQLWFALGNHVGSVTPSRTVSASDGDVIYVWDARSWMPGMVVEISLHSAFLFCFGLTPTSAGQVTISDINFYNEDELNQVATSINSISVDANHSPLGETEGAYYDLCGRELKNPKTQDLKDLPRGIYIKSGKKLLVH